MSDPGREQGQFGQGENTPRASSAEASEGPAATSLFAGYEAIVLVANSDEADVSALSRCYGEDALFVFFNKVYKVLDRPFPGKSVLIARSSPAGANIVYRREVEDVLSLLRSPSFGGVVNLKAGAAERFSKAEDFGGAAVAYLDLTSELQGFYPPTHVATSGFALALHLIESLPDARVVLAGFSARRSERWKLFHDHDWTFEQIVLRLLERSGRLVREPGASQTGVGAAVAKRFPQFSPSDIALATADVLAERLEGANHAIDGLLRDTRLQRKAQGWIRALKPATRKEKLARGTGEGKSADGPQAAG